MRKINVTKLILASSLMISSFVLNPKNTAKAVYEDGRVIVVTQNEVDLNEIYKLDEKYKDIEVEFVSGENVRSFDFRNEDVVAVDIELAGNQEVRNFALDRIKDNYVTFIGNSDYDTLSNLMNHQFKDEQPVYSSNSGEVIADETVVMDNVEFSALKYTDNPSLMSGKEVISVNSDDVSMVDYVRLCLDVFIRENSQKTRDTIISSETYIDYYKDMLTDEKLSDYICSSYRLYQVTEEKDSKYDYYTLKTIMYSRDNGRYLQMKHSGANVSSASTIERKPISTSGTTSYSFNVGFGTSGITGSVGITYSGQKAKIELEALTSYSSRWTVTDKSVFQTGFKSGDQFEFASSYSIAQNAKPGFCFEVYGLDKSIGRVNYKTYTVRTS